MKFLAHCTHVRTRSIVLFVRGSRGGEGGGVRKTIRFDLCRVLQVRSVFLDCDTASDGRIRMLRRSILLPSLGCIEVNMEELFVSETLVLPIERWSSFFCHVQCWHGSVMNVLWILDIQAGRQSFTAGLPVRWKRQLRLQKTDPYVKEVRGEIWRETVEEEEEKWGLHVLGTQNFNSCQISVFNRVRLIWTLFQAKIEYLLKFC